VEYEDIVSGIVEEVISETKKANKIAQQEAKFRKVNPAGARAHVNTFDGGGYDKEGKEAVKRMTNKDIRHGMTLGTTHSMQDYRKIEKTDSPEHKPDWDYDSRKVEPHYKAQNVRDLLGRDKEFSNKPAKPSKSAQAAKAYKNYKNKLQKLKGESCDEYSELIYNVAEEAIDELYPANERNVKEVFKRKAKEYIDNKKANTEKKPSVWSKAMSVLKGKTAPVGLSGLKKETPEETKTQAKEEPKTKAKAPAKETQTTVPNPDKRLKDAELKRKAERALRQARQAKAEEKPASKHEPAKQAEAEGRKLEYISKKSKGKDEEPKAAKQLAQKVKPQDVKKPISQPEESREAKLARIQAKREAEQNQKDKARLESMKNMKGGQEDTRPSYQRAADNKKIMGDHYDNYPSAKESGIKREEFNKRVDKQNFMIDHGFRKY